MRRSILAASVLLAGLTAAAQAQVAPIADLTDGVAQLGNFVSTGDNFADPTTWRVYTFDAAAGDSIVVRVTRTTAQVDPIAYAHLGDLTGADVTPGYDASDLSDFGLTFVAFGDDSVDDPFGGPFGDPLFAFAAPADGTYTVITHMYGNYEGNPGYEIQVTGSSVPAPGAAALAATGVLMCGPPSPRTVTRRITSFLVDGRIESAARANRPGGCFFDSLQPASSPPPPRRGRCHASLRA